VVFLDQVICVDLVSGLPRVVVVRVALPFDQILKTFETPILPVTLDTFHFEFFFSVDKVW
jgi:hypothetical protein